MSENKEESPGEFDDYPVDGFSCIVYMSVSFYFFVLSHVIAVGFFFCIFLALLSTGR